MTYWAEVMQDDTHILVQDGWAAGRVIRELVKNADGKFSETPDITLGRRKLKAELIPPALIVARFFGAAQAKLEALQAKAEEAARAVEELDEEPWRRGWAAGRGQDRQGQADGEIGQGSRARHPRGQGRE
jgi:type I restriction enzyme M protein